MAAGEVVKNILRSIALAQSGKAGDLIDAQVNSEQRMRELEFEARIRQALEQMQQQGAMERTSLQEQGRLRRERAGNRASMRRESFKQKRQGIRQRKEHKAKGKAAEDAFGRSKELEELKAEERRKTERVKGNERRRTNAAKPSSDRALPFPTLDQFRDEIAAEARAVMDERTRGAGSDSGEPITPGDRSNATSRVVRRLTGLSIGEFAFTNEVDLYRQLVESQRSAKQGPAEKLEENDQDDAIGLALERAGVGGKVRDLG
jgi:hypothetical protein